MAERPRPCPICGKPATAGSAPFCCPRCAEVDLHRWLTGAYQLPGEPVETEPEERDRRDDA